MLASILGMLPAILRGSHRLEFSKDRTHVFKAAETHVSREMLDCVIGFNEQPFHAFDAHSVQLIDHGPTKVRLAAPFKGAPAETNAVGDIDNGYPFGTVLGHEAQGSNQIRIVNRYQVCRLPQDHFRGWNVYRLLGRFSAMH
jgi:hypothetical protein